MRLLASGNYLRLPQVFLFRKMSSTTNTATSLSVDAVSSKASAVFTKLRVGPMKRLYKYYTPTAVNLAGGVPMERIFPFESVRANLTDGSSFEIGKATKDLSLNYLRGDGIPELKDWINSHVASIHKPGIKFESCATVGSTDAFAKVLGLLSGDCVIFDKFAYGAAVSATRALGRTPIGVEMDEQGMIPSSLRTTTILARQQGFHPDVIYLVPTAQNPTGITMSEERKKAIYDVCCELDLVVIEDDAYYYLHFGEEGDYDNLDKLPGIKNLPKSMFSMDKEGRVLRVDSLSKFIAPGMRLGWIAGPADFIAKYLLFQEATTQFPSGMSQSMFLGLIKHWKEDGLDHHARLMQAHYRKQRDFMYNALAKYFKSSGSVSYNKPNGGMFLWLKLATGPKSEDLFKELAASGVITVPGGDFQVPSLLPQTKRGYGKLTSSESSSSSCSDSGGGDCGGGGGSCSKYGEPEPNFEEIIDPPIIRLTYAAATQDQIEKGVERLANGLKPYI